MAGQTTREAPFSYACDHYMDTVYRLAVHNTSRAADAEDVTQEVFEALLRCRKPFQDAEHLKAWLIRVTLNRCKNLRRDSRWEQDPLPEDLPAPAAADRSVLDEVRALRPPYGSVLYLHYYEGYTAAEIGEMMGAGANTALSWLRRGREALRKRMIGGFEDE